MAGVRTHSRRFSINQHRRTEARKTLFLIPIEGAGFPQLGSRLEDFARFASVYFQMEV